MPIRFISEKPVLAEILEAVNLGFLPKDVREWAIGWIRDVGATVRSREMMVGFTASIIYYIGAISLIRMLGVERLTLFPRK